MNNNGFKKLEQRLEVNWSKFIVIEQSILDENNSIKLCFGFLFEIFEVMK